MKINKRIISLVLACVLLSGCGSKEESKTTRLVTTKASTSVSSLDFNEIPASISEEEFNELRETYDYVGEPFTSQNGYRYVKVGKVHGEIVLFGLYNRDTKKEDLSCKCDMISKEAQSSYTEDINVWISVPGDDAYECGLFNMTKLKATIPCSTYSSVGQEWRSEDGNVHRWLEIPNETGIVYGLFNVDTLELELFESYEQGNNSYECTESDGKVKVIELG